MSGTSMGLLMKLIIGDGKMAKHYKGYKGKYLTKTDDDEVMPFDEIGKKLGISTQAAAKLYERAMKKIKSRSWRLR